jgi:hypothetical protein
MEQGMEQGDRVAVYNYGNTVASVQKRATRLPRSKNGNAVALLQKVKKEIIKCSIK